MNKETTQPREQAQTIADDAEFQRVLGSYVDGVAGQYELVACIDSWASTRQAAPEAPTYQIANDDKPSGWSDVTLAEYEAHTNEKWRKKRIIYASTGAAPEAPASEQAGAAVDNATVRELAEFVVERAVADHIDTNGPDYRACAACGNEIQINGRLVRTAALEHRDDCLFVKAQAIIASPAATTASAEMTAEQARAELLAMPLGTVVGMVQGATTASTDKLREYTTLLNVAEAELSAMDRDLSAARATTASASGECQFPNCDCTSQTLDNFCRRAPAPSRNAAPDDIRAAGWAVAVHNDYRLNGEAHTFWLFTKGDRAIKGEGKTDSEALDQIRATLTQQSAAQAPSRDAAYSHASSFREVNRADFNVGYDAAQAAHAGADTEKPETVDIEREGGKFWHMNCTNNHLGGVMREKVREADKSLIECLNCGKCGYYPVGRAGLVRAAMSAATEQGEKP